MRRHRQAPGLPVTWVLNQRAVCLFRVGESLPLRPSQGLGRHLLRGLPPRNAPPIAARPPTASRVRALRRIESESADGFAVAG